MFVVLSNRQNPHIHGTRSINAEIIITMRKSLNLLEPLYSKALWPEWFHAGHTAIVLIVRVRDLPVEEAVI